MSGGWPYGTGATALTERIYVGWLLVEKQTMRRQWKTTLQRIRRRLIVVSTRCPPALLGHSVVILLSEVRSLIFWRRFFHQESGLKSRFDYVVTHLSLLGSFVLTLTRTNPERRRRRRKKKVYLRLIKTADSRLALCYHLRGLITSLPLD